MIRKILLLLHMILWTYLLHAQEFYPEIALERYTIAGQAREGYSSRFAYPAKEVEKGWWKYSRTFGRPLNMKDFYQVTVPRAENSGNVDLVLFSKTFPGKAYSKFFLAINQENFPKEKTGEFNEQVKNILESFKQTFYLERLEKKLALAEKKARRWSKKVDKAPGKNKGKALDELELLEAEMEVIKTQIKQVYGQY